MKKFTQKEFLENIQIRVFGDYKDLDDNKGHSGPNAVMGSDFYSDIYGKILTLIEATSDKSNVDQKKSIAKQLMRESYNRWFNEIFEFMRDTEIQEIGFIDGLEISSSDVKLDLGRKLQDGSYYNKDTGTTTTNTK